MPNRSVTTNYQVSSYTQKLPYHENATAMIQNHLQKVKTTLSIQSELIAHRQNADIVLACHISEALHANKKSQTKNLYRELMMIIGGALLGAFTGEFLPQLLLGNTVLIGVYVLFGFVGVGTVIWALQSEDTNLHT